MRRRIDNSFEIGSASACERMAGNALKATKRSCVTPTVHLPSPETQPWNTKPLFSVGLVFHKAQSTWSSVVHVIIMAVVDMVL